jgi:hypothetical protein
MIDCKMCPHSTETALAMDRHLYMIHRIKKRYFCNDQKCHKLGFVQQKCLNMHRISVHNYHSKQNTENKSTHCIKKISPYENEMYTETQENEDKRQSSHINTITHNNNNTGTNEYGVNKHKENSGNTKHVCLGIQEKFLLSGKNR